MNALIEAAKTNGGFKSDYSLAKAIGVSGQMMSSWTRGISNPNGLYTAKIMEAGKIEPKKAIELIEGGYTSLSLIFVTAIGSIALLASFWKTLKCILC